MYLYPLLIIVYYEVIYTEYISYYSDFSEINDKTCLEKIQDNKIINSKYIYIYILYIYIHIYIYTYIYIYRLHVILLISSSDILIHKQYGRNRL